MGKIKKKISKTKIDRKLKRKENPKLRALIILLKKQKKPFWILIADLLSKSTRKSIAVNVEKINRLTKRDDLIIVPGKILSQGNIDHTLTIASFSVSQTAKEKLKNAKLLSIEQLLKQNPQGKGVKIIV